MTTKPKAKRPEADIRSAIVEYMAGEKLKAIAGRHGVHQATVSGWARKWGDAFYPGQCKLRTQGRRKDVFPNKRDQKIMKMLLEGRTLRKIAMKYGISRARVAAIYKTWHDRGYEVPKEAKA